jgi:hypothetical protein
MITDLEQAHSKPAFEPELENTIAGMLAALLAHRWARIEVERRKGNHILVYDDPVDDAMSEGLREVCYLLAGSFGNRRELLDAADRIAKGAAAHRTSNPSDWGREFSALAVAFDGARLRNGAIWIS